MERSLNPSEIRKLCVAERMLIVEEIWEGIAADQESLVTEPQKRELDRRIALHNSDTNPGNPARKSGRGSTADK